MNIEIKFLESIRWKEFKNLRLNALLNDSIAFGRSYDYEKSFSHNYWKNLLKTNTFLFVLINNKVVGMIGYKYYVHDDKLKHVAKIIGVYIDKDFRRMKLGQKLVHEMIKLIKKNKFKKIKLEVIITQEAALNLYKKFGFKIVGKLKKELKINNYYYDELILEKLL